MTQRYSNTAHIPTVKTTRAIMETICGPCAEKNKRLAAEKYCSDCEEKLCTECTEWHLRCGEFRSHHVIDLSSVRSRIPPSSKINCEIHTDVQIDYFCCQHDVVCCRSCLSDSKDDFLTSFEAESKGKQTHKTYGSPRDKFYSIQHHVDYRNNQSGRLCVFHSLS